MAPTLTPSSRNRHRFPPPRHPGRDNCCSYRRKPRLRWRKPPRIWPHIWRHTRPLLWAMSPSLCSRAAARFPTAAPSSWPTPPRQSHDSMPVTPRFSSRAGPPPVSPASFFYFRVRAAKLSAWARNSMSRSRCFAPRWTVVRSCLNSIWASTCAPSSIPARPAGLKRKRRSTKPVSPSRPCS